MSSPAAAVLRAFAPAKVNLTLHVLARAEDGFHVLDSLVTFAAVGDVLMLEPGDCLSLALAGPGAAATGAVADNLVLKAARAFAARVPGAVLGHFNLEKRLPSAAGIGGGSSDAAAALRLLGQANALAADDWRLLEAAAAVGSDVPVCLAPATRVMRGRGEVLGAALPLEPLAAVLVNPGVAVPTGAVFAELGLSPGQYLHDASDMPAPITVAAVAAGRNDLEAPARRLAPVIGDVLDLLRAEAGCRLARMSGSGATCFALFDDEAQAATAASSIGARYPGWWVTATELGLPY